jgi:hypothetical protein
MSHSRARIPRPAPERPIEVPQAVSGRQNGRRRAQWRKRQLTEDVAYPTCPSAPRTWSWPPRPADSPAGCHSAFRAELRRWSRLVDSQA